MFKSGCVFVFNGEYLFIYYFCKFSIDVTARKVHISVFGQDVIVTTRCEHIFRLLSEFSFKFYVYMCLIILRIYIIIVLSRYFISIFEKSSYYVA